MNSPVRSLRATQLQLDFLRGVAAVIVLLNHTRGSFYAGGERILADNPTLADKIWIGLLQSTALGTEAVVMFFVLSGYAMAHSIRHSASVPRFYLKRWIRIWPPYAAACLLALLVGGLVGAEGDVLSLLTYLAGSPVAPQFWSLPYEVLFYLACPVLLSEPRRIPLLLLASGLAFIASGPLFGPTINPSSSVLINFLINELFFFACGAAAYEWFHRIPVVSVKRMLAITVASAVFAWVTKRWLGQINVFSEPAVILVTILWIRNLPESYGKTRWNLGFMSYSLYLCHYQLLVLMGWYLRQHGIVPDQIRHPLAWVAALPLALAGAYLFYLAFELPTIRLLERMRRTDPPAQPLPAG